MKHTHQTLAELASLAYSYATEHAREFTPEFMGFYDEKFAELIIQECIRECRVVERANNYTYSNLSEFDRSTKTGRQTGAAMCVELIRARFEI